MHADFSGAISGVSRTVDQILCLAIVHEKTHSVLKEGQETKARKCVGNDLIVSCLTLNNLGRWGLKRVYKVPFEDLGFVYLNIEDDQH